MQIANNLPQKMIIETKADKNTIAPVETSPSTHAYSVGDILYFGDKLYEVIVDISINDNLVIDTNIEEITLDEYLRVTKLVESTAVLDKDDWSSSPIMQSLTVQGVKADSIGNVGINSSATLEQRKACQKANVYFAGQGVDTIIFKAESIPTEDIPIVVNYQRGN